MNFKYDIIYEDDDILVINKPAGVVVNEADSYEGETIQGWFANRQIGGDEQERTTNYDLRITDDWRDLIPKDFNDQYGTPEEIWQERRGLVHRLDKDTSGVLILAKNPGSLVNLLSQFKKRQTKKKYVCLVHGGFSIPEDTIRMPIGRASGDRKKFAVNIEGRMAVTHYRVLDYFDGLKMDNGLRITKAFIQKSKKVYQGFSLVECKIETGRTHQIRVHMAMLKHPIVGDVTYLGKKRAKLDPLWCPRQFLHAKELTLHHPRSGEEVTFEAELGGDLLEVLKLLSD